MEAIVGGSYNGGTFAETKPECWGEVVDDDEPAAGVGVADDTASNPRDGGDKLVDEDKPVKELVDPDEDPNIPHDSAGKFTSEEVLNTRETTGVGATTGLEAFREASKDTQLTKLLDVEVMEAVNDARAVEAEVGGAEVSSPDETINEDDTGTLP